MWPTTTTLMVCSAKSRRAVPCIRSPQATQDLVQTFQIGERKQFGGPATSLLETAISFSRVRQCPQGQSPPAVKSFCLWCQSDSQALWFEDQSFGLLVTRSTKTSPHTLVRDVSLRQQLCHLLHYLGGSWCPLLFPPFFFISALSMGCQKYIPLEVSKILGIAARETVAQGRGKVATL